MDIKARKVVYQTFQEDIMALDSKQKKSDKSAADWREYVRSIASRVDAVEEQNAFLIRKVDDLEEENKAQARALEILQGQICKCGTSVEGRRIGSELEYAEEGSIHSAPIIGVPSTLV